MGDGGQTKASKKLPDPVRYSPPRPQNAKTSVEKRDSHNGNVPNGHIAQPVNGYGPHLPKEHKEHPHDHRDVSPPHTKPKTQAELQRNNSDIKNRPQNPSPPKPQDVGRSNDKSKNGKAEEVKKPVATQHHPNGERPHEVPRVSEKPRYYDDSELPIRRQQMESQGWPRDPKDYLIGGIHGPEPRSKPNESQHAPQKQHSQPRNQPYRSRSFPREARGPLTDKSHNNSNNNNNSNSNSNKRPGGNSNKAFSLIDVHEGDVGKGRKREARGRGPNNRINDFEENGMASEYERLYPRDGLSPPVRNGPRRGAARGNRGGGARRVDAKPQWNSNFRKAGFDEAVVTSDIINNDGLNSYKARLITFYKNGDPFFPGIKISMKPGRDFSSFEALCNYLTPRTDLPAGVRYVFSLDGRKIRGLDELEDGGHYVCSSRKKYLHLNYGMGKHDWKPHSKFANQEDWKLFRPPSPGSTVMGNRERRSPEGQPGSREGRVIRVINNDDHTIQSRILLNLRTAQPWEEVLQDLGQALKMPAARRMFTYTGQEVQSFSQLRNDFREVDTFYLCTGESFAPNLPPESSRSLDETRVHRKKPNSPFRPGSAPERRRDLEHDIREPMRGRGRTRANTKSHSPPAAGHVDPVRVKIKGQRREVYPPMNQRYQRDESPPDKNMELNWVYPSSRAVRPAKV